MRCFQLRLVSSVPVPTRLSFLSVLVYQHPWQPRSRQRCFQLGGLFHDGFLSLLVLSWLFGDWTPISRKALSTSNRSLLYWPETHGLTFSIYHDIYFKICNLVEIWRLQHACR